MKCRRCEGTGALNPLKVIKAVEICISDLKRLDEAFFANAIRELEACNVELAAP